MSSSSPADDSQNAPKKNTEAPGIMKFFKSLGKTNNADECAEHAKTATFSALGTSKQKDKMAPKTRKKSKTIPRVTRNRRRVKPPARNAKKPKTSRSNEGTDKDSVYDILDISDDQEDVTIIEYSEFLKQQQISKETKNDTCGNSKAEETAAEEVQQQQTAPSSVITGYFKPVAEEQQPSRGKAKRPSSHAKVKMTELTSPSRPKRACTMLRNSFDTFQQEMLLDMFDRKARKNLCRKDVLDSQHPMRLRHKRDSFEQYYVPPEEAEAEEPTKSPRSSKHKKKKRSKSQSEVAQTVTGHENTNEVYTSTIIEERSDFKCPRLRITRVSKDHDDTVKDDLDAKDNCLVVKELTNQQPVTPVLEEARTSFLESGIPEKLRREVEAVNAGLENFIRDCMNFPTVSHVRQLTDDIMWTLPNPKIAKLRTALTLVPTVNGKLELGSLTRCKKSESWQPEPGKPFDPKQVLAALQQEHPKLAIGNIFERYLSRKNPTKNSQTPNDVKQEVDGLAGANDKGKVAARGKRTKKGNARPNSKRNAVTSNNNANNQHTDDIVGNSSNSEESSLMWTEKFQPQSSMDIIGNERAVQQLRSWLHHWKQKPRQDDTATRVPKRKRNDSATDEDYIMDEFCHAQLLVGPCGIGKTATVYALANEIGFEVIEVNASSKRAGKLVLSQLQEATQSHSVNNGPTCDSSGIASYFQKVNNRPADTQKPDKTDLKRKYPMGTLILFKDVDIVFEEDDGFTNAVNSFIEISKRPIILTTSDQRFLSSNRLTAMHEEIRFEVPNWDTVMLHMQLVSLAEGMNVSTEELLSATPPWKIDIRHAILTLQYRNVSAMRPQVAETGGKELPGNAQRRRKRPTKQALLSQTADVSNAPSREDTRIACRDLPRDAELQTGRILTVTTGKSLITDDIVGACWRGGVNFTVGPSKHVLEQHKDGTNNSSPGDAVRVDGKLPADIVSDFADRTSAADLIQWQTECRSLDVVTQASRDFIRPGTSDSAVQDSESWCTKTCAQDVSEYLRTLNWENFSKYQRGGADSQGGVHVQWTRDALQTQICKAREDVGAAVKNCSLQTSHALDLDYMPWLKVICRAEGIRHVSNKKRGGGRYLHYLDSINLSLQPGTLSHLTNS